MVTPQSALTRSSAPLQIRLFAAVPARPAARMVRLPRNCPIKIVPAQAARAATLLLLYWWLARRVTAQLVGSGGVFLLPSGEVDRHTAPSKLRRCGAGFMYIECARAIVCVSILLQRYRDSATLAASHAVSQFARSVQPVLDSQAELNMLGELERTTR